MTRCRAFNGVQGFRLTVNGHAACRGAERSTFPPMRVLSLLGPIESGHLRRAVPDSWVVREVDFPALLSETDLILGTESGVTSLPSTQWRLLRIPSGARMLTSGSTH